jgi:hypothetical protein
MLCEAFKQEDPAQGFNMCTQTKHEKSKCLSYWWVRLERLFSKQDILGRTGGTQAWTS